MSNISMKLAVVEAMLVDVSAKLEAESPRVATAAALNYALTELRSLRVDVACRQTRVLTRLSDVFITCASVAFVVVLIVCFVFGR